MEEDEKLKAIKREFRLMMNGEAVRSMRNKGLNYHLNWGVSIPDLRKMAVNYGKDEVLAARLWNERIRECKILATMIMPVKAMQRTMAETWIEQTEEAEVAEQCVFNLFQHLPFAPDLAQACMAASAEMTKFYGFLLLARLLANGWQQEAHAADTFLALACETLRGTSPAYVRHAAFNSLSRFSEQGESCRAAVSKALNLVGLELF